MVNGFSMSGDTARKWVGNRQKTKSTKAYQASVPSVFSVVKNFKPRKPPSTTALWLIAND